MPDLIKSSSVKMLLGGLLGLILLCGAFQLGLLIGVKKTRHASGISDNYDRMFNPRGGRPGSGRPPFEMPFAPQRLPGAHGAFGKVVSVSGTNLVITGKDTTEQNVLVTSSTVIRVGRDSAKLEDIKPDADVAVFGEPNDGGQIDAHLIRIFPAGQPR